MKHLIYILTQILFFFYSFELKIIKPRSRKSLNVVPTVFEVRKSMWWTIILGAAVVIVLLAGISLLAPSSKPSSYAEILQSAIIAFIIISAFFNQLVLKGRIEVTKNYIEFDYRNIFGRQIKKVSLSNYQNIWVQKMRTRVGDVTDRGKTYVKILIKHPWNRFRSVEIYEGKMNEDKIQFYSNLFDLPIKKSIIAFSGKYFR